VIRIPVHPLTWESISDYLWRYLDDAVCWAGEYGMYVIIDWNSIGNVKTGSAPEGSNMFTHTWENTTSFWNVVSAYFAGAPNVLFEVFNEPESITVSE
jgi:aryl-phospho-beta-D-glucosidase BglC (GH1 family)